MATTVYEVKEVLLEDGSTITLKPAVIAVLRKGQKMIQELGTDFDEEKDDSIHRLLDIVCLCLKRQRPEFEHEVEVTDDEGKPVTDSDDKPVTKKQANYELMEDLMDIDTMYEVIDVFLGVKLNDPKILEEALRILELQKKEEELSGASSS